jgi:hypothetical protein
MGARAEANQRQDAVRRSTVDRSEPPAAHRAWPRLWAAHLAGRPTPPREVEVAAEANPLCLSPNLCYTENYFNVCLFF